MDYKSPNIRSAQRRDDGQPFTLNRHAALTIVDPPVTLGRRQQLYQRRALNGGNNYFDGTAIAGETITLTDAAGGAVVRRPSGRTATGPSTCPPPTVNLRYVATATDAAGNRICPALSHGRRDGAQLSIRLCRSPAPITLSGTIDQTDAAKTVTIYDGGNILER